MNEMEEIYRNRPLDEIPWNSETPPPELVELIESGKIAPCKAIDLGCGAGNYAIYLVTMGFEVTGIDISPTAIEKAEENAKKRNIQCRFLAGDVFSSLDKLDEVFGFAYDWQLLHHLFPDRRKRYVHGVQRILDPKGKYLSVCFSDQDNHFGGTGKYRKTSLGTTLYFSSEHELQILFEPYFTIIDLKTIEISGKFASHVVNYAFMTKKNIPH